MIFGPQILANHVGQNSQSDMRQSDPQKDLVSQIFPYQKGVTIVIDALDKCLDSTQLSRHLLAVSKDEVG